eukprot:GHRQ01028502.1.p1 GENE.GHRQ01028502.1~~GHRQ01028502.1.p1  ORF type:complete len:133 (-),score=14.78 GHRQ01028502.1:478-876(-)
MTSTPLPNRACNHLDTRTIAGCEALRRKAAARAETAELGAGYSLANAGKDVTAGSGVLCTTATSPLNACSFSWSSRTFRKALHQGPRKCGSSGANCGNDRCTAQVIACGAWFRHETGVAHLQRMHYATEQAA